MTAKTYTIGICRNARAPVHETRRISWDEIVEMTTQHEIGEKDGPAWCPGIHQTGPRRQDRASHWDVLVLDIEGSPDDPAPAMREIASKINGLGWHAALATSWSHTPENPRYRVIFDVSRPVEPREIQLLGLSVADRLGLSGWVDTACLEPSRLFYLPRAPQDRIADAERAVIEGAPIEVDSFLKPHAPQPALVDSHTDVEKILANLPENLRQIVVEGAPIGERSEKFFAVVRQLRDIGMSPDQIVELLEAYPDGIAEKYAGRIEREVLRCLEGYAPASPDDFADLIVVDSEPVRPLLRAVPLRDLRDAEPPAPRFWVDPLLPECAVTLLGAHGGVGKSTWALTLAAHIACGVDFAGLPTRLGRVGFLSLEDPGDLLRWRLRKIIDAYGLPIAALAQNMVVWDATTAGPLVEEASSFGAKRIVPTPAFEALRDQTRDIDVVIVDNASDAFDGNEVERRGVRAFIRALASLIEHRRGAVLLLAHLPKAAVRNAAAESYSGSTAWHNSARSRLALLPDGAGVRLEHQKLNAARRLEHPLLWRWSDAGVLIPAGVQRCTDDEGHTIDDAVFEAIAQGESTGCPISTSVIGSRAGTSAIRAHLAQRGVNARSDDIRSALARLEAAGRITRALRRTAARHEREVWATGGALNAPNAPNAPNRYLEHSHTPL